MTVPDSQCPVCKQDFQTFSDHARCDGCFDFVHFQDCSSYKTTVRQGDDHLYIFCYNCDDGTDDLADSTYQDEDGYWHPKDIDTSVLDEIDWSDFDEAEEEDGA